MPLVRPERPFFQHNSSLLSLDLAHNGLGPAEALILAPAFRASTSLRRVILDHNPIGHTGGSALLHVLQAPQGWDHRVGLALVAICC